MTEEFLESVLPENSYITFQNFTEQKEKLELIKHVLVDDKFRMKFHEWRNSIDTYIKNECSDFGERFRLCGFCKFMNKNYPNGVPKTPKKLPNLYKWWSLEENCNPGFHVSGGFKKLGYEFDGGFNSRSYIKCLKKV